MHHDARTSGYFAGLRRLPSGSSDPVPTGQRLRSWLLRGCLRFRLSSLNLVLLPLGANGPHRYATRFHDLGTDEIVREWAIAPAGAVVLFDATFLQRDDLRDHWDEVIYLDATMERAQARGIERGTVAALGGIDRAVAVYEARYMAACRIYLAEQSPRARASIVIDNDDPTHPLLLND